MGKAGRRRAEAEFSWDAVIDEWEAFLAATVSRTRDGH
jgi:glycosyltransferase involved in cell wall biosynthesis